MVPVKPNPHRNRIVSAHNSNGKPELSFGSRDSNPVIVNPTRSDTAAGCSADRSPAGRESSPASEMPIVSVTGPVSRRRFLAGATAAGLGAVAGCLGGGTQNTVLAAPNMAADPEDLAYPAHGQEIPDVALPAPLHDETIALRERDTTLVITFFYSHCQTICPRLISTLRNVQSKAAKAGIGDDIELHAVTFDPERDTADRLREFAEAMRVDLEAGNWYFLRPDGVDRAKSVVADTFGLHFERTHPNGDDQGYMFTHMPLILVVNPSGYVERSYTDKRPVWQDVYEAVQSVVEATTDG